MNKKVLIITFIILTGIFIYPSFRFPGVDCLAGCSMPKGLPLAYDVFHGSGIVGGSSREFLIGPLILDIIIWFLVAVLIAKVIFAVKQKTSVDKLPKN
jgi:hypothetical protein